MLHVAIAFHASGHISHVPNICCDFRQDCRTILIQTSVTCSTETYYGCYSLPLSLDCFHAVAGKQAQDFNWFCNIDELQGFYSYNKNIFQCGCTLSNTTAMYWRWHTTEATGIWICFSVSSWPIVLSVDIVYSAATGLGVCWKWASTLMVSDY